MDLRTARIAHRLPLLGILLVIVAASGFPLKSEVRALDQVYCGFTVAVGVACVFRTRANEPQGVLRVLLLVGAVAMFAGNLVRVAAFLHHGLAVSAGLLFGVVSATGTLLGAFGILGSALALKEEPGNSLYRALSFAGAVLVLVGMALSAIGEGARLLQARGHLQSLLPTSIGSLFYALLRASLFASAVLTLLRAPGDADVVRRQTFIVQLMGIYAVGFIANIGVRLFRAFGPESPDRPDSLRFAWLSGIAFFLFLANAALLSRAFLKSGYNSGTALHTQGGAGA